MRLALGLEKSLRFPSVKGNKVKGLVSPACPTVTHGL